MTQHIVIEIQGDEITVTPAHASVWRDDQTIMWHVREGLCWPKGVLNPIQFENPAGESGSFAWPGTTPTPLGDEPIEDGTDQRLYVALARKLMPDNTTEKYVYTLFVAKANEPDNPLRVQIPDGSTGIMIDPDVENQAQP
ncbi:MAG TPA: hypothetical protein VF057_10945 [Thermoanaerobaculia bacterium]